jgi:hypothetical protein
LEPNPPRDRGGNSAAAEAGLPQRKGGRKTTRLHRPR